MSSNGDDSNLSLLEAATVLERYTSALAAIEDNLSAEVLGTIGVSSSGGSPNPEEDNAHIVCVETTLNQPVPQPINPPKQGQTASVIKRRYRVKESTPIGQR